MAGKRVQMDLCMEFGGSQYPVSKIRDAVKQKVLAEFPDAKKIGVYMQPETNYIYYTVDGKGSDTCCISFDEIEL